MSLTKDAVLSEITANPTLKSELISSLEADFLGNLKQKGIFRTTDEEKEFLTNYEKTIIPEKVNAEIGSKVKAVHDAYDNDLFELTGKRKEGNEKTYDFLKRQIAEIKKSKGDDSVAADKLRELEAELQKRKDWVPADKLSELEQRYFSDSIKSRVSLTLDKIAIAVPAHITEEKAKQDYTAMQREMIKSNFLQKFTAKKDAEGNTVYYLGETLQIDTHTAKPKTEAALIAENYAGYFVPETKSKTGMGSGKDGKPVVADVNEANLKTKGEVIEYLNKKLNPQGIKGGSQAYNKEYARILTDYGITQ